MNSSLVIDVNKEMRRVEELHKHLPDFKINPERAILLVFEEKGEAAKATLDYTRMLRDKTTSIEGLEKAYQHIYEELVHTIAMATLAINSMQRKAHIDQVERENLERRKKDSVIP